MIKIFIRRFPILFILINFVSRDSSAQTQQYNRQHVIQMILEKWIEYNEAGIDYTELQSQLEYYTEHKLNLNKVSSEELQSLVFLSQGQIEAIIGHRKKYGNFINIHELGVIPSLDEQSIYYLTFFITLNDESAAPISLHNILYKGTSRLIALHENEFQQRAGYKSDELKTQGKQYYLGSPYKYILRYLYNYSGRISFGYTAEKDMGEQFFQGVSPYGFDFNSVHFIVKDIGNFKSIALGDYQVNFGQGLTFGSGLAARKSAFVINVRRYYQTIRPYKSTNENAFLRGAAFTYQKDHWQFTPFFSYKYTSTNYRNTDSLSDPNTDNFSSLELSGLHRTPTEILNKNNVLQQVSGLHIQYHLKDYTFGLTAANTNYDHRFEPGTKPYQKYNFRGDQLNNAGFDYSFPLKNAALAGELSFSSNGGTAMTHSVIIPLDEKLDICFLYRNFTKDYQASFNNPLAENNNGSNEEGIYSAISFRPNRFFTFNAYIDMYRSPWLRDLVDAPSQGYDMLSELQYNPSKTFQAYLRYKHENKEHNQLNDASHIHILAPFIRDIFRFHIQYKIDESLSASSRIEYCTFNTTAYPQKEGTLIYQDLNYKPGRRKWSLSTCIILFDVNDFYARIFAFEDNMPYSYSVPLYQNSGVRYYFLFRYTVMSKVDLYIRYSNTTYGNIKTIASGLQQINGNTLTDLKLQLQWSF